MAVIKHPHTYVHIKDKTRSTIVFENTPQMTGTTIHGIAQFADSGGDDYVINTAGYETHSLPTTFWSLYFNLLAGKPLLGNWIERVVAPNSDRGVIFLHAKTKSVTIRNNCTVVVFGDFGRHLITGGSNNSIYILSETSTVYLSMVDKNSTIIHNEFNNPDVVFT